MWRFWVTSVFLSVTLTALVGCTRTFSFRVKIGNPPILKRDMLVTTKWLQRNLGNAEVVVVHVSKTTREGYDAEHIPGARFLSWSDISTTRDGVLNELRPAEELAAVVRRLGIDESKRVILYDEDEGVHAARAYVTLDYLGLGDRAALLDGQWKTWKAEGRPTTGDVPNVIPTTFAPRINPGVVVPMQTVRDIAWAAARGKGAGTVLVDARSSEQYTGEEPGERVKRGGHIPGSVNVFSERNVADKDTPVLRPVNELRRLYETAGAQPGDSVVTYCRTGGQGSLAYFVAKYLGYDARLYDGSFTEWSGASDTPVATGPGPK